MTYDPAISLRFEQWLLPYRNFKTTEYYILIFSFVVAYAFNKINSWVDFQFHQFNSD